MSKTEKQCVTHQVSLTKSGPCGFLKKFISQTKWTKFAKGSLQIFGNPFSPNPNTRPCNKGSSLFKPLQSQTVTMKIIPKFNILNQDTIPDKIFGDPENWNILAHKMTI